MILSLGTLSFSEIVGDKMNFCRIFSLICWISSAFCSCATAGALPNPGADPECGLIADTPSIEKSDKSTIAMVHKAIEAKDITEITSLVWLGANPHLFSGTPWGKVVHQVYLDRQLISASARGDDGKIKYLLKIGANVNAISYIDQWMSPIIWTSRCGNVNSVKILLSMGADLSKLAQFGVGLYGIQKESSALIWASENGYYNIVDILLRAGADPNINEQSFQIVGGKEKWIGVGRSALGVSSDAQTSAYLINAGADVNYQDGSQYTPLMNAAARGDSDSVRLLLKNGANLSLKNLDGMTALDIARDNGKLDIVDIMENKIIH